MPVIVQKFGGTSVGSIDRIQAVADRVASVRAQKPHVVVVVSAMGDTTDDLIAMARRISRTPDPREYDALISTGENISAALVSMALNERGVPAVSLTGPQVRIVTENFYNRAKILKVDPARVWEELNAGKVVVITGFQGVNARQDVTTIGRGGSDTSAVVMAAALGAPVCEIYTDVDGIYTTDPRIVKTARKLDEISYDEMLELASLGAKVLHPRAVECAKENGVIVHVRSSFNTHLGTLVKEASAMENNRVVTGITLNEEEAKLSIFRVPDQPGVAGRIFSRLAELNINVDMIVQSVERNHINNISFTVNQDEADQAEAILSAVAKEIGAEGVRVDRSIAKVSIVGVGMISKPGVAARMFTALGEQGINLDLISTSEIKVSCVVNRKDGRRALETLHRHFGLDVG
jgi:aspartate kinase